MKKLSSLLPKKRRKNGFFPGEGKLVNAENGVLCLPLESEGFLIQLPQRAEKEEPSLLYLILTTIQSRLGDDKKRETD